MTNLQLLKQATDGMTEQQTTRFENYFIGSLSALTTKEMWEQALKTAARFIQRDRERLTGSIDAHS